MDEQETLHTVWGSLENSSSNSSRSATITTIDRNHGGGVEFQDSDSSGQDSNSSRRDRRREGREATRSKIQSKVQSRINYVHPVTIVGGAQHSGDGHGAAAHGADGAGLGSASGTGTTEVGEEEEDVLPELSEEEETLLGRILSEAALWSEGSHKHISGQCTPCRFIFYTDGCRNGIDCQHCHMPHTNGSKNKVSMLKRRHCKACLQALQDALRDQPDTLERLGRCLATRSLYTLSLVMGLRDDNLQADGDMPAGQPASSASGATSARTPSQPPKPGKPKKHIVSL